MREIKTLQDDTLDLIAWREYGEVFGYVEELMNLNPHLLDLEKFPPAISVYLPDIDPKSSTKVRRYGD
jgi:phage tail protein X